MTAYLIVRAEVPEADRAGFDTWYQDEHLPEAHRDFGTAAAWRGWSNDTPGVHLAFYEFPSLDAARTLLASDTIKAFIAEFDRVWEGRVTRSREVVEVKQSLGG
ncbi:MAG: hypothetical protein AAF409_14575 [Pseudomonadota bacterium]